MKKPLFISATVLFLLSGICQAQDIDFYTSQDNVLGKTEIPVTGDYDKSSGDLALKFSESSTYTVTVYGDSGIVYSSSVTVDTFEEIRINVRPYDDNEAYNIVVADSEGNRYEGDFFA